MGNLNNIVNKLNTSNKNIIKIDVKSKNKNLLKILIKINFIKYIYKNNDKYYAVINYLNKKKLFKIKNIYKKSQEKIIKFKNLKKVKTNNKILFISTNKGVLNNFESMKKKTGGIIKFLVWN